MKNQNSVFANRTVLYKSAATLLFFISLVFAGNGVVTSVAYAADDQNAASREMPSRYAPVYFENREIVVFRASYEGLGPADRARGAMQRLEDLPVKDLYGPVKTILTNRGIIVSVGTTVVFGIFNEDLDAEGGETAEKAAATVTARLQQAVGIRLKSRNPAFLLQVALRIGIATLCFVILAALLIPVRRMILRIFERETERRRHRFNIFNFDLLGAVLATIRFFAIGIYWSVVIVLAYIWLQYCLDAHPYTMPWATAMGGFLWSTIRMVALAILRSFPKLLMVLIIFLVTRFVAGLVRNFFHSVETGHLKAPDAITETAAASRRLANFFVWLFGLAIAYPFLPGSDTEAFKGISVFAGLIFTIGSSGVVNHLMSGLVLVYARALRKGDYVRVGDVEGTVIEMGALSTRIVTRLREEFSIPNTVMVGSTIKNYTRMASGDGVIVSSTVTIGYDAPWRQVHAMLLLAARRTEGLKKEPEPYVLQTALSDFYVEYKVCGYLDKPEARLLVLSELHAHIQDIFNEHGVQIMSPHFENQPEGPVGVEKSRWYAAPAHPPREERKGAAE